MFSAVLTLMKKVNSYSVAPHNPHKLLSLNFSFFLNDIPDKL